MFLVVGGDMIEVLHEGQIKNILANNYLVSDGGLTTSESDRLDEIQRA